MTAKKTTNTVDARLAAAYNAAPQTRQKKAQVAMRPVLQESLDTTAAAPCLPQQETTLFLSINRHLPPEQQCRYETLRTKREQETLTPEEHIELLQYVETIATLWSDRLQALLALAQLRHISPQQLMQQLGIAPQAV